MKLQFQQAALHDLEEIADRDLHSILISGVRGTGKTYAASYFSTLKGITTFHSIQPKMKDIKEALQNSALLDDRQVICIEDLDDGMMSVSQALLKYLEEPLQNVYVIITCNNVSRLTNTIPSRAISVEIQHPSINDLAEFAKHQNMNKYNQIKDSLVFKACRSLSDVKFVLNLTNDQINYYQNYQDDKFIRGDSNSLMWNMSHYDDNQPCEVIWCFKSIVRGDCSSSIKKLALSSLLSFEERRLSKTAILGEFVIQAKL